MQTRNTIIAGLVAFLANGVSASQIRLGVADVAVPSTTPKIPDTYPVGSEASDAATSVYLEYVTVSGSTFLTTGAMPKPSTTTSVFLSYVTVSDSTYLTTLTAIAPLCTPTSTPLSAPAKATH